MFKTSSSNDSSDTDMNSFEGKSIGILILSLIDLVLAFYNTGIIGFDVSFLGLGLLVFSNIDGDTLVGLDLIS